MKSKHLFSYFFISLFVIGCATIAQHQLDQQWGEPEVQNREVAEYQQGVPEYHRDIQPIFDKRCVSCHACYDGPCQLKLSSYDGLDRGASKELVYDGARIVAAEPSRLGVDAKTTEEWRARDYFPVLNERAQNPVANVQGSLLLKMLEQKRQHPLPQTAQIDPDVFDVSTDRAQECSTIEEYERYADAHPQWGMPFGLPAISDEDFNTIQRWVEAGSPVLPQSPLGQPYLDQVSKWEAFFNGQSNKEKLFSRYAYEHLFLANIWFEDLGNGQYFNLVRSRTPSGQAIDEIASRRPFDDPNTKSFYYRLKPVRSTIVDKTHMPYKFNDARMKVWREWFLNADYEVTKLPGYDAKRASNPFITFKELPAAARYKFMLQEAEFTIMGYIKGPVCRGQVALNVIEDHFWVFFVDPEVPTMLYDPARAENYAGNLRLPAEDQSTASPFKIWTKYAALQEKHLNDKIDYINSFSDGVAELSLDMLWSGKSLTSDIDGSEAHNSNAALTIFRHFDNATVVNGLHGDKPKTAWVISYSLLERIHYLLVAGFDVYGNLGHQLNTRLYMDFLRMEGESNFLMLLPDDVAEKEFLSWYQSAEEKVEDYLNVLHKMKLPHNAIEYGSNDPKNELLDRIYDYTRAENRRVSALPKAYLDQFPEMNDPLQRLEKVSGIAASLLPELAMVRVKAPDGQMQLFSIASNRFHENVSSLFMEDDFLVPERDTLTLYPGVLGSYPKVFFDVHTVLFDHFVERISQMKSEEDYVSLLDDFAVRRTDPTFWDFSDWLHVWYMFNQSEKSGIVDLNRYENR
ncbi:hypothetical protein A3762_10000 [Oleiphilus sp. HI0125]|uniref:fatty acid cis/trans isomerase n=3 Tax=Oleiphilus sp. HI0125 TaxID=1822266 RepID=UPI0007C318A8|nr:fatty acid cis/trans isomerase [Oleiphilus sp. HI0125]KZZ57493.1 hypothetical protein A3762_10000 [Oleiphilus sp. HI0125]